MTEHRRSGISFGDLAPALESEGYPLDRTALLERHGDAVLTHANGSVTLRAVLEPAPEQTYRSADDVTEAVLNMIGQEAEGRIGYTDREPNARSPSFEEQSF